MITSYIEYKDNDVLLEAYCAYDDKTSGKKPAVLVAHDWSGRNDFAIEKANRLAQMGYVGVALDAYGKGKFGTTNEEKSALIKPFLEDRQLILRRMLAGLEMAKQQPYIDSQKIGAMGFCFGGLCVLDLARSGADLRGVVSFHGLLHAPEGAKPHAIKAKVLALHGYDDPMVKPEMMVQFANEMTQLKANWEMDVYGNTMHAFTNPKAHDTGLGLVFEQQANDRSMAAMERFFKEVLA